MKVSQIEVFRVAIPLSAPFHFGNAVQTHRDHIIVSIACGSYHGWGESGLLKWPLYSSETTRSAFVVCTEYLAPLLLGAEFEHPDDWHVLCSNMIGNPMAKAAFDFALWDIFAQQTNQPLYAALGGKSGSIPIGISIGKKMSEGDLRQTVENAVAQGFKRIKFKISPGFPVAWIESARKQFPNHIFSVDGNASFKAQDLPELIEYEHLELAMIEQPFHPRDYVLSAKLQSMISTPICLDEGVESPQDLEVATALNSARCLNIKPARVGGLTPARQLQEICREVGWQSWVGGLLETGIGRAHNAAFASSLMASFPHDISECGRYGSEELIHEAFTLNDGNLITSDSPGIGVSVDTIALQSFSEEVVSFE